MCVDPIWHKGKKVIESEKERKTLKSTKNNNKKTCVHVCLCVKIKHSNNNE